MPAQPTSGKTYVRPADLRIARMSEAACVAARAGVDGNEVLVPLKALPDHGIPFARQTIRKWVDEKLFPSPITLGGRRKVWRLSSLKSWIEAQAASSQQRIVK